MVKLTDKIRTLFDGTNFACCRRSNPTVRRTRQWSGQRPTEMTSCSRCPMVRVDHDDRFEGPDGRRSLPELFDGRSQLILYRFYFEEGVDGWPDAGCAGCSADGIPHLGLLHAGDITFAMVSPAPQANLRRYAERMGWTECPGTRSAPSASPPTSGSTNGSDSTSSCRHDGFDEPPPSPLPATTPTGVLGDRNWLERRTHCWRKEWDSA